MPVLGDKAGQGADGIFVTPVKHHRGGEITIRQKSVNRAHARLRSPVERAFTRLKAWPLTDAEVGPPSSRTSCAPHRYIGAIRVRWCREACTCVHPPRMTQHRHPLTSICGRSSAAGRTTKEAP
ncbi:transposase family protein [Streptomyces sp. NPDC006283]|uniref:transposase family protein n=1 Tax=Streptomyces sp. NPDC006283 TaxID=3156741 RepID=UPI0033BD9F87